jgi:hypothetical protein
MTSKHSSAWEPALYTLKHQPDALSIEHLSLNKCRGHCRDCRPLVYTTRVQMPVKKYSRSRHCALVPVQAYFCTFEVVIKAKSHSFSLRPPWSSFPASLLQFCTTRGDDLLFKQPIIAYSFSLVRDHPSSLDQGSTQATQHGPHR